MTPEFRPWQLKEWGHFLMKRGNIQGGREKMGMEEMESNSLGQIHSVVSETYWYQMETVNRQVNRQHLEFRGEVKARNKNLGVKCKRYLLPCILVRVMYLKNNTIYL